VIVVVLITVLLASLMLMKFFENSAVELTLATREADRSRLRADAYSALETALAVMAEINAIDRVLHSPDQGWGDPYAYLGDTPREGLEVSFSFFDESGKASLPSLSFEQLAALAEALGLAPFDARRFADALFVWMNAEHAAENIEAESSRYERDLVPHQPPRRSLRSWEELRAVRVARDYVYDERGGLSPFGRALRDNLSLFRFESSNINSLAPAIAAARGWDPAQIAAIAAYQSGRGPRPAGAPVWFRNGRDLASVLGANADTSAIDATAKLIRVEVRVREGAATLLISAWVTSEASVTLPPAFVAPGETPATPAEQSPPAPAGARPPGGVRGGNSANSRRGGASEERLNYPFRILQLAEITGPEPVVAADEAEETEP
jgi:general secretion pathway protein K